MNRQSITSNEVRKGADAQVYSICRVFLFVGWWVDLIMPQIGKVLIISGIVMLTLGCFLVFFSLKTLNKIKKCLTWDIFLFTKN